MSDASLTRLIYMQEAAFGVLVEGDPMTELRFLSSEMTHEKLTVMSEEIRADRARSSLIQVGKNATGPLNTEFIVGAYNDFILGALMAEAWTAGEESGDVTIDSDSTTISLTLDSGTFPAALRGAKFVLLASDGQDAQLVGIKRVVSWTDTILTFAKTSEDPVIGASGVPFTFGYRYARNGSFRRSFMFEQQYLGMDPEQYIALVGMAVNEWTLNLEAQARVMQTFAFMGTQAYLNTEDPPVSFGGDAAAHSTRPICNTTGNIGSLTWDGLPFTDNVMSLDFTMGNNLRNRPAISRETTLVHGRGRSTPDGSMNAYFESAALLQKFLEHEAASLLVPITDADGNLMSVFLPHIEFPSGFPSIPGIDTDVMLPMDFNATNHDTLGYAIQVDQLDAPAAGSGSS